MSDGWIKLHRKLLENPLLRDDFYFRLFVREILLKATHQPHRMIRGGREITLDPGQLCISMRALAREMKVSEKTIRNKMAVIRSSAICQTKSSALGTVITVCNWSLYQSEESDMSAPKSAPSPHYNKKRRILDSELNSTSESYSENQSPMINSGQKSDLAVFLDFPFFWNRWRLKGAKRGDKKRAERIYDGLVKSDEISHDEICKAVDRQQDFYEQSGVEVSKMLHPATWLHQKRWNDELVPDQPRKSKYGISSAEDLAARFVRNNGFGGPDDPAKEAPKLGQGDSEYPNGKERPGHGDRDDGGRLPQIPSRFDQDGD